jgi:hypothetical protein
VEERRVVRRLFLRAAERVGSASALARSLGLTYPDIRSYLNGEAIPAEDVLLRTVSLVIDDLELLKGEFSAQAWSSLSLPGTETS